jgi:RES domain-containing protein
MSELLRLLVWRLVKEKHLETAFDGEGARLNGGRWNSLGRRMVYTSESLALATLETLVHLDPSGPLPRFAGIAVTLPPEDIETFQLPPSTNYKTPPFFSKLENSRRVGDRWLKEKRSVALRVPSAIVPSEYNVLLNPAHPRFEALEFKTPIGFKLDARLMT